MMIDQRHADFWHAECGLCYKPAEECEQLVKLGDMGFYAQIACNYCKLSRSPAQIHRVRCPSKKRSKL